jgi:hypothetical protein
MKSERFSANRTSWKLCLPLPKDKEKLPFQHVYSEKNYRKLSFGLVPEVMEDKWFIFMENDVLSFHRSWTGVCIYEVHFEKLDKDYSVKEAWVNRDSQQYGGANLDYDCELLNFLIENLLLGNKVPFPLSINIIGKVPKGIHQHSFSGTGYSEKPYDLNQSKDDEVQE